MKGRFSVGCERKPTLGFGLLVLDLKGVLNLRG